MVHRFLLLSLALLLGVADAKRRFGMMDSFREVKPQAVLDALPSAHYVTQPKDHFSPTASGTWEQAYYVNDTFWKPGSDAPVFLCVGGEGPALDATAVSGSVHCNVAVEWLPATGALMFAVEHRYYGCHNMSACPYADGDANPLQYLSSHQALADLANFHSHAVSEYKLSAQNKWVSFGGSYPGMLAGWFRVKYPELVHAAVASSAPVLAQLDMRGYNDVTAAAYGLPSVGGSQECTAAIADGHSQIGQMFESSTGRDALAKLFPSKVSKASELESLEFQQDFAGFGVVGFPSQSNDPTCIDSGCNIAQICKVMHNATIGTPLQRLATLVQQVDGTRSSTTTPSVSRSGAVKGLGLDWEDYWNYQTCTQFGFYQTCEKGSACFYTQGLMTLDVFIEQAQCASWNISKADIAASIEETNTIYGGLHPNASRILWPNGDVDPWHALAVLTPPSVSQPTLMVSGASHHAWTHPSASSDQPSVVKARAAIRARVAQWLKGGE